MSDEENKKKDETWNFEIDNEEVKEATKEEEGKPSRRAAPNLATGGIPKPPPKKDLELDFKEVKSRKARGDYGDDEEEKKESLGTKIFSIIKKLLS